MRALRNIGVGLLIYLYMLSFAITTLGALPNVVTFAAAHQPFFPAAIPFYLYLLTILIMMTLTVYAILTMLGRSLNWNLVSGIWLFFGVFTSGMIAVSDVLNDQAQLLFDVPFLLLMAFLFNRYVTPQVETFILKRNAMSRGK